jgi:hypothetical protein
MPSSDEEKLMAAIPAEFHMISGSHDVQTSADVFDVNKVLYYGCGLDAVLHDSRNNCGGLLCCE